MVMNQNAAAPITARITTTITSLRSIGRPSPVRSELVDCAARPAAQGRVGLSAPAPAPDCHDRNRLRRLFAVGLMAAAAILAHLGDLDLEAVEVLGRGLGRLGVAGELGELGGKIGLVLPNCR